MSRISSGIPGFDSILFGGWPVGRLYLVHGLPGTGKTTLGFQFLLDATRHGQRALYVSLSETKAEVQGVAAAHGWSLEGVDIFELEAAEHVLGLADEQTMFDPSDVEFRATSRAILLEVERVRPDRVVFDSLSELALLARDTLAFRRELLTLKRELANRGSTVMLLSDGTAPDADRHLYSLAHGVVEMEERTPDYGPQRRRLRVRKLRGSDYRGGFHDFEIRRGGLEVFPRIVAPVEVRPPAEAPPLASGLGSLDALLGGGLPQGASTLFMGPAGSGKSSLVALFAHASAEAGSPAAVFLFDEEVPSFLNRTRGLGRDLAPHVEAGRVTVTHVNPAQLSPGELMLRVRRAVEEKGARYIAIDSLNGYVYSMAEERFLIPQLHQLLSYLARSGVTTGLVLAQAGLLGEVSSPAEITYIADTVVLLRFFESGGEIRRAISVVKKRSGVHDRTIRELRLDHRIRVGEPLREFDGVLTGTPRFLGLHADLLNPSTSDHES